MERRNNPSGDFSEEELQREADKIRVLIDAAPELQDVHVTEDMDKRLMEKIRKYEEEEVLSRLSKEDRDALLIGRKLQNNNHKVRKMKRRRVWISLAAAMVVVIGVGTTSVGGKNIIVEVFEKTFGSGEKTYVDTEDIEPVGEVTEEEAYQQIEDAFGVKTVRVLYKPKTTKFLTVQIDKELQEAILFYSVEDKIFTFRMISRYVDSSIGMEQQNELLQEYTINLPEKDITICEWRVEDSDEIEYRTQFSYNDSEYFLAAIMSKEEFEKIVKNLLFP